MCDLSFIWWCLYLISACNNGTYGHNCQFKCSGKCLREVCDKTDGNCTSCVTDLILLIISACYAIYMMYWDCFTIQVITKITWLKWNGMMCYTLDGQQGKWKCLPDFRIRRNRQDYVPIFTYRRKCKVQVVRNNTLNKITQCLKNTNLLEFVLFQTFECETPS